MRRGICSFQKARVQIRRQLIDELSVFQSTAGGFDFAGCQGSSGLCLSKRMLRPIAGALVRAENPLATESNLCDIKILANTFSTDA